MRAAAGLLPDPLELLVQEHDLIQRALYLLEGACASLDRGGARLDGFQPWVSSFLRDFADRAHHAKEETVLFPLLAVRGGPEGADHVRRLTDEHQEMRGTVAELSGLALGREAARTRFAEVGRTYVARLRRHIWTEHEITFERARGLLTRDEWADVATAFRDAERSWGAEGCLERHAPELAGWETRICRLG